MYLLQRTSISECKDRWQLLFIRDRLSIKASQGQAHNQTVASISILTSRPRILFAVPILCIQRGRHFLVSKVVCVKRCWRLSDCSTVYTRLFMALFMHRSSITTNSYFLILYLARFTDMVTKQLTQLSRQHPKFALSVNLPSVWSQCKLLQWTL